MEFDLFLKLETDVTSKSLLLYVILFFIDSPMSAQELFKLKSNSS